LSRTLRFDEQHRAFEVSVGELAEAGGPERMRFDAGEGWNRLGLGVELHTRVLQARVHSHPGYRREVFLQGSVAVDDWTAVITGRLDGCFQEPTGRWVIEEFKSCGFSSEDARRPGGAFDRHRRQTLSYCFLWELLGNGTVAGRVVYVDLATARENSIPISYEFAQARQEIQNRLRTLLAIWRAGETARALKAQLAARLPFPHLSPRPGQATLMEAVRDALESGGNLLAEAPTGSGKTAAGLYPALVNGLSTGRQVVFATSKTLQQRMAVVALKAMNAEGGFRSAQIRAKERMCANDRVFCHEDFCPYARDYAAKMDRSHWTARFSEGHTHYDPDEVFEAARAEQVCPFEAQLELAARADAIVADYNYVFDPGAALRHLDGEKPFLLLVDEAHNLADRARKIFSPELFEEPLRALAGKLLFQSESVFEPLARVVDRLVSLMEETAEVLPWGRAAIAEAEPPIDALRALWEDWEPAYIRYLSWKREQRATAEEDPIVDAHYQWHRFMMALNFYGEGFACVVERRADGLRLAVVCLDPAQALGPVFRSAAASVLLSATLSPVEVTRRLLGLNEARTRSISLPPPFPRENRKILILPQVSTTYANRERNYSAIGQLISSMADAQPRNALALFPSFQFLKMVQERMPATRAQLRVQKPDFAERERREIFESLAAPPPEGILLMAALGGMFAEGVDYPGELLSAVFIVSPGLPQVSFERELLKRYFDLTEGDGFEYAYLQPGMTRVIQAAGRLIRSETDRGVIALVCNRFLREPYAKHLPRDWYVQRPLELAAKDPALEIREFFSRNTGLGTPA